MKKTNTEFLLNQIVESIQDRKGKKVVVADLTSIEDTITNYFIICEGYSPNQVSSIANNVKEEVKENAGEAPLVVDGLRNAEWVAMDYADVIVHIFQPEARNFYNLETLWADAQLKSIPDID